MFVRISAGGCPWGQLFVPKSNLAESHRELASNVVVCESTRAWTGEPKPGPAIV